VLKLARSVPSRIAVLTIGEPGYATFRVPHPDLALRRKLRFVA